MRVIRTTEIQKITHLERGNLHLPGNLSDAQVYWPLESKQADSLTRLDIFHLDRTTIDIFEEKTHFFKAFGAFHMGLRLPNASELMLIYSASIAMEVVFNELRNVGASKVQMIHPTFDATYHTAKRHRLEVTPVEEERVFSGVPTWCSGFPPDALILTVPNNPTGRTFSTEAFTSLCVACVRDGVKLVLDCCFRAYEQDLVDHYEIIQRTGVEAAIIEDTGKLFNIFDIKLGILWATTGWRARLIEVHKDFILEAPLLNLLVLRQLLAADPTYGKILRDRVARNRDLANAVLSSYNLKPIGAHNSGIQLYELPDGLSARNLCSAAHALGLGVVEADGFYWATLPADNYIRIALARTDSTFNHQLEILSTAIEHLTERQ
ncbi:aminotransferase class I/II-fold pyridoxal phosphate-dependent enzyme [Pseudomonas putida]|uniref:aminotransferase class I/II-fold pyridoxal phosphate-dependent enzyme n=1 Tax=Pseudomonas putida TaxID=303 RepID=UPI0023644E65|nr:aminotransferase class I/II-fold pyridoxal phosphate-dependent enzyme [Pseudomonas putida]MDD2102983.1 aminotransferase class I/II-fold pyridoxal phosphate-dependent enzyme [Pseudomonas putida]